MKSKNPIQKLGWLLHPVTPVCQHTSTIFCQYKLPLDLQMILPRCHIQTLATKKKTRKHGNTREWNHQKSLYNIIYLEHFHWCDRFMFILSWGQYSTASSVLKKNRLLIGLTHFQISVFAHHADLHMTLMHLLTSKHHISRTKNALF